MTVFERESGFGLRGGGGCLLGRRVLEPKPLSALCPPVVGREVSSTFFSALENGAPGSRAPYPGPELS